MTDGPVGVRHTSHVSRRARRAIKVMVERWLMWIAGARKKKPQPRGRPGLLAAFAALAAGGQLGGCAALPQRHSDLQVPKPMGRGVTVNFGAIKKF